MNSESRQMQARGSEADFAEIAPARLNLVADWSRALGSPARPAISIIMIARLRQQRAGCQPVVVVVVVVAVVHNHLAERSSGQIGQFCNYNNLMDSYLPSERRLV